MHKTLGAQTLGARSRQALGATRNVYSLDLSKPLTRPCCSQAAQQRCAMSTICGTNTATALAVKAGLRICAQARPSAEAHKHDRSAHRARQ